jgi:hypothetical protein
VFSREKLEKNAPPNVLMHAWPLVQKAEIRVKTPCFLCKIAPPNVWMHAWPLVKTAENAELKPPCSLRLKPMF